MIFYPGCLITYRFPYIEKSMRLVANRFNIKLREPKEFTCCPDPQGLQSYNEELWILTAARNLAIAESLNLDIFTICNGCYSTFRKVSTLLKEDSNLLNKINLELDKLDLNFKGKVKIKHLHELILRDIGLKRLEQQVTLDLSDLKIATHYGCHLIRPSNIVEFDDHRRPRSIEKILTTLGAKNVDYEGKDMCCGGSLNFIDEMDSFKSITKKISNIKNAGADCIAVLCPYCFLQFEIGQLKLQKNNFEVSIPVLHLSEIIAMALGIDEIDNLLKQHKIKADFKLSDFTPKQEIQINSENFRLDLLKNCAKCRACSQDCSLVSILEFDPLKYVDLIIDGKIEEAIKSDGIWYCLNCYSCLEKCPQRMGLAHFFTKLRNLAIKLGYGPQSITSESKKFLKEGIATGKILSQRKKLDLSIDLMDGIDDLKKLIHKKSDTDVET